MKSKVCDIKPQNWEVKNVMDTAFKEGKIEGLIEGEYQGVKKVAKALKDTDIDVKTIINTTGLSEAEIERL